MALRMLTFDPCVSGLKEATTLVTGLAATERILLVDMPECMPCRRRLRLFAVSVARNLLFVCFCLSVAVCEARAAQRATACVTQKPRLQCLHGERIVIQKLLYSYNPSPCLNPHPDNNCTVEDSDHLKEVISECDGRISCSPNQLRDEDSKAPARCLINKAVYVNRDEKFNYMDIAYDCQSDTFCTELSRHGPEMALIRTTSYPAPTAPTSSSCECQFSINNREAQRLNAYVTCPNSTVRFRYESVSPHSATSVKESSELLCKAADDGSPLLLVSVQAHRSLTVSVYEDGSDERSAYSVSVAAFRHSGVVDNSLPVSVTCKGSSVIFTKTEKIIIGVTLPGVLIILIVAIIAAKIIYTRRKRRQSSDAGAVGQPERSCGDGSAPSEHIYYTRQQQATKATTSNATVAAWNEYAHGDGRSVSSTTSTMVRSSSGTLSSGKKAVHAAERLSRDPSNADLVAFAVRLHNNRKLQEADGFASLRSTYRSSSLRSTAVRGPKSLLLHSPGGSYQQLCDNERGLQPQPLFPLPHKNVQACSPSGTSATFYDGVAKAAAATFYDEVAKAAAATFFDGAAKAAATEKPSLYLQSSAPRPSRPPPPVPSPQTAPPPPENKCGGCSMDVVRSAQRPKPAPSCKPLPPPKPSKLQLAAAQAERPASKPLS